MAGKTDYKNAWLAEKLDRINLTVPKGKKEIIQKMAADLGLSVNAFINQAIDEQIQKQSEQ
jgi:predicted HicB family RNase H-like nuclease